MNEVSFNQVNVSSQDSIDIQNSCDQCEWVYRFIGRIGGEEITDWKQTYVHINIKILINKC